MNSLYLFPISFAKLLKQERLPNCDLPQSIRTHIHLIINTRLREYRRDDQFGCEFWDKEYEILPNDSHFQVQIKEMIKTSLNRFEGRLQGVEVDIRAGKSNSTSKKLIILITGIIKSTATPFSQKVTIYLCPQANKE